MIYIQQSFEDTIVYTQNANLIRNKLQDSGQLVFKDTIVYT